MQMFADKHKQTTEDERKKQNKNSSFPVRAFSFQSPRWKYTELTIRP